MPIFDFECPKCKRVEERFLKTADPPPICPECDIDMVKIPSGSVSFRLYGEGFYKRNHKDSGDFS